MKKTLLHLRDWWVLYSAGVIAGLAVIGFYFDFGNVKAQANGTANLVEQLNTKTQDIEIRQTKIETDITYIKAGVSETKDAVKEIRNILIKQR